MIHDYARAARSIIGPEGNSELLTLNGTIKLITHHMDSSNTMALVAVKMSLVEYTQGDTLGKVLA